MPSASFVHAIFVEASGPTSIVASLTVTGPRKVLQALPLTAVSVKVIVTLVPATGDTAGVTVAAITSHDPLRARAIRNRFLEIVSEEGL